MVEKSDKQHPLGREGGASAAPFCSRPLSLRAERGSASAVSTHMGYATLVSIQPWHPVWVTENLHTVTSIIYITSTQTVSFTLGFAVDIVHSMGGGCYSITQIGFTVPTSLVCCLFILSCPLNPGNNWWFCFFCCLHSFAFFRMSYTWNHIVCSFFRLDSFS